MPNYINTFQAASVGAALPSGLTSRWANPNWSVIDEADDKIVHMAARSPSAAWGVSLDAVDADADRDDSEILVQVRSSSIPTQSLVGAMLRGSGTTTADATSYSCRLYGPSALRIVKVIAGAVTTVASVASGITYAANTFYWIRFRANGNSLRAKVWAGAVGDEPGAWLIDTTDASISAAGYTGWIAVGASVQHDVAQIAVATNGDTATLTADTTAPVLSSPTGTAASAVTASGTVSTDEGNGTLFFLATTNATELAATVIAGGATGSSQPISSAGLKSVNVSGLAASTVYYMHYVHVDAALNISTRVSSTSFTTSAADSTPPTLSAPSGTQTGATTATLSVSTNENNGVMYAVVTTSATPPTAAQIRAGQNNAGTAAAWASNPSNNQTINSTGTKTFGATGLLPSTTYYAYFHHRDASGNDSTVAAASSFTTAASGVKGIRLTLFSGTTAQANLSGLTVCWWDVTTPHTFAAPLFAANNETTDAAGTLEVSLAGYTSLAIAAKGFLLVYKADGSDTNDSLVFAGQVAVTDIA